VFTTEDVGTSAFDTHDANLLLAFPASVLLTLNCTQAKRSRENEIGRRQKAKNKPENDESKLTLAILFSNTETEQSGRTNFHQSHTNFLSPNFR
jgi:hypothetical protein